MANPKWTIDKIPNLSGKVVIVTGANSGIGFETAKELARKGAQTILACRNLEKGDEAAQGIRAAVPEACLEAMALDLGSLRSVRAFADTFKKSHHRLDVLVNNAGILWVPYGKTEDGFERHFGTNHLGHFALTGLLMDLLLETSAARVVTVSSLGHRLANMDFDNLMYEGGCGYHRQLAYDRSKLANLLFTFELQRFFDSLKTDAITTAAHPGAANTNIYRCVVHHRCFKWLRSVAEWIVQNAAAGALPTLRAATDPQARGGDYFGPGGWMGSRGHPIQARCSRAARDAGLAKRLWKVSEELTGITYRMTGK